MSDKQTSRKRQIISFAVKGVMGVSVSMAAGAVVKTLVPIPAKPIPAFFTKVGMWGIASTVSDKVAEHFVAQIEEIWDILDGDKPDTK